MAEKAQEITHDLVPYHGKARSTVWKTKEGPPIKENLDMGLVICRICMKSYANKGNTTNLQLHLDKHHRHQTEVPTTFASRPTPAKQPKKDASLTRTVGCTVGKLSQGKKLLLEDQLHKLIVAKCLPLSLVDSSYFKAFVKELDPRFDMPSKYELKKYLERKSSSMKAKLSNELPPEQGHLAITYDSWTSMATESFDTVTAHFITDEWEIRSAVLQTSKVVGSHTSEHIAERLQETMSKWSLPKKPTVVTDNAANEKKAVEKILGWPRFGCYGHRLNLAVKHPLEVNEISRILGKSRKTVTLFHQSTRLTDCLLEKQRVLYYANRNQIGLKLVADVPTRWNSSLFMLERLSQQVQPYLLWQVMNRS